MRIAITADHNGVDLKQVLTERMRQAGHVVDDRRAGARPDDVVDYPALCADVCYRVVDGAADRAVVVGGSGQGEHVACNKIRGIRAGLPHDRFTAEVSRGNNDSNVLVLGAKVLTPELAAELLDLWLVTPFKGGVHRRRLDQIACLERGDRLTP